MSARLVERVAVVAAVLVALWFFKGCYDERIVEGALAKQKLETLQVEADALRKAHVADSIVAAAASDSAAEALEQRDAARDAYRKLAAKEPTVSNVPVTSPSGDTTYVAMVLKTEFDELKAEAAIVAAADSVALAAEQAAHAATRRELLSIRDERDNALERFNASLELRPSTGDKLASAGKWALFGAVVALTLSR